MQYLTFTVNSSYAVVSAMIGKFAISGAFNVVFIFCCELFPTLMRSMGVGSSSMAARIGGIAAPYLLYLGEFESLPLSARYYVGPDLRASAIGRLCCIFAVNFTHASFVCVAGTFTCPMRFDLLQCRSFPLCEGGKLQISMDVSNSITKFQTA